MVVGSEVGMAVPLNVVKEFLEERLGIEGGLGYDAVATTAQEQEHISVAHNL
jgi:hypothetical protein